MGTQKSVVIVSVMFCLNLFHVLSLSKVESAWTEWVSEQEVVSVHDTGIL